MQPPIDLHIRTNLARYLAGEITLEAFEEWFIPATWDIERSGNPAAESLTADLLLILGEYSDGGAMSELIDARFRSLLEAEREPATTRHD